MSGSAPLPPTWIGPSLACVRDTCNVYVARRGADAVLVDFGSGAVLDRLDELGVERVTDVLVTHHHRDQVQGLARAAQAGIRIWVPPLERDLIDDVEAHWQSRQLDDDYDLRQDRFSLLEPVAVTGTVDEYRRRRYGWLDVETLPTPGHTTGSVSYLVELNGRRIAFCGDLAYAGGRVWSLAATQWSISGVEGQAATVLSCATLLDREPDLVLPSHGPPIEDPPSALGRTRERLRELADLRRDEPWDLDAWLRHPWEAVTPHLLRNRTSVATSYALLSQTGAALLIDWGYDQTTGLPPSTQRAARRPLLTSIDVLRRDHGVRRIDAVVVTHAHDDHVAGVPLLRDVEGAQVWAPAAVVAPLEDPRSHDLPCLWFDPIAVDRRLEPGEPVGWHEYELTTYPLPGHTLHAGAIAFTVDGVRVVATGDQQAVGGSGPGPIADPQRPPILNYQYRNRFRIDDYVASAQLLAQLAPDLIVSGHWPPQRVDAGYLDRLLQDGRRVARLHRELLPLADADLGAEGFAARIEPYRSRVAGGDRLALRVALRNPFPPAAQALVAVVVPDGWAVEGGARRTLALGADDTQLEIVVRPPAGRPARRARVAVDVTVDGVPFGQQAEALVDVT
jgi:glyoxylase-like metal-dependent hydrolase (beta-lactamase superfamily II)